MNISSTVVGVASSPGEDSLHESLLLDLLNASLSQLSGASHVTYYRHDIIQTIVKRGAPHLKQAVILSVPLLLRTVTGYWGAALPSAIQDTLVALVTSLFQDFSRAPTWHTALVLRQVFASSLPCLSAVFQQVLPFLEASTQAAGFELLSLAAAFVPTLLARGRQTLAVSMVTALQQLLLDVQDASPLAVQLCALHLASALGHGFAGGVVSPEAAMAGVTLLADLATKAVTAGVVQLSLGLLLHHLSACGHREAHALAESVGAKWLQELETPEDTDQVVAVMIGLVGLVGVDLVRGVASWEALCSTSQHSDMMLTLAYLVVDKIEKLSTWQAEGVGSLALWVATHTAVDVSHTRAQRERVPPDYRYLLTSAPTLTALLDTCRIMTAQPLTQQTGAVLTALLQGLSQQPGLLPPMDYSSLLLPCLLASGGCGPELQQASLQCLARTKEGQGFKHVVLYCTLPHVFPLLQEKSQMLLLECLPLCVATLHGCQHLDGFLCQVAMTLSSGLLPPHSQALLVASLQGVHHSLAAEGLDVAIRRTLTSGLKVLHRTMCQSVRGMTAQPCTVHSLLHNKLLWRELARCSALAELELLPAQSRGEEPAQSRALEDGARIVGLAVCFALVVESAKPFKHLTPVVHCLLSCLPARDGGVKVRSLFYALFNLLLQTLHLCCSPRCKNSLVHQTELLHMLSSWTRDNKKIHVDQWRAVLLLALTGSILTPPDSTLTPPDSTLTPPDTATLTEDVLSLWLDICLTRLQLSRFPSSPSVTGKLIQCLLEWLGNTDCDLIRATILGHFSALKSCEEYKKSMIWSTVAHLL